MATGTSAFLHVAKGHVDPAQPKGAADYRRSLDGDQGSVAPFIQQEAAVSKRGQDQKAGLSRTTAALSELFGSSESHVFVFKLPK